MMTCGIHGEMSADGQHVIVIAAGQDWEVDRAAAAMRAMTPLFTKTKPPGALQGPLTWTAVTQLALTFNGGSLGTWLPGPRLRQWVTAGLLARIAAGQQPAMEQEHAADPSQPAMEEKHAADLHRPAFPPGRTAAADQPARAAQPAAHDQQPAEPHERAATVPQSASATVPAANDHQPAASHERAASPRQPAMEQEHAAVGGQPAIAAQPRQPAAIPLPAATPHQPAVTVQPAQPDERAAKEDQPAIEGQPAAKPHQPATLPVLTPRPYQLAAARMIGTAGKALLFDEPGTGKTVSTILGLVRRQRLGHGILPMVVIVPSWDVAEVWARHVRDWAPGWPVPVMHGGKDRAPVKDGIMVTTYATARLDAADASGPLVKLRARAVVCDEVHFTRNENSQQSQAVRRIASHADTFVGLSGTPVTRDTGDIFPVLAAMDPASWSSRERFVKRYLMTTEDAYQQKVEGLAPLAEPEFRAVLLGQYRRVAKADVLDQLPPKIYSVRKVELPGEWRAAYSGMASDMLAELPDDGGDLPVMSILAQLTRLSQLASSACDVEKRTELNAAGEEVIKYDVTLRAPSWKVDSLLEILAERKGQQVAVFAVSRQLIDIAGAACEEAGYRCGYITGGQGKAARRNDIDAFQAGQLDAILATAGAGSLGITLTRAGTVVMMQRSWQLDQALQPEDRAHRIGNENDCVEIIDILAKDTVDERVRAVLREKGGQLGSLLRDPRVVRELMGGIK
jgi:superfamily II DNA or RNA helicase